MHTCKSFEEGMLHYICCFSRVFLFPVLRIFEYVIFPFIGIEDLSGRIPLYYFVEQLFEGSSIVLTGRCIVHTCSFLCKLPKLLVLLNCNTCNHTLQYQYWCKLVP